jgi:hypothetical protein
VNAQKPFDNTHKINLATLCKKTAEERLHSGILREVYKVIDVKTKGERARWLHSWWVRWILNKTRIEARVFKWWSETNRDKNHIDFIIPVL